MTELPVQESFSISFDTTEDQFLSEMGLDRIEAVMAEQGVPMHAPTEHYQVGEVYVRQITMPKGFLCTSMIHRTRHPYFIVRGDVSVWIEGHGTIRMSGPYAGITEPGTRRLLFCHEETVWQTYHASPEDETVEQVGDRILEPHFNPFLGQTHAELHRIAMHKPVLMHND